MNPPVASLSLDLDNQWSYMKTHGDSGWEEYPSYFDIAIPRILDILDQLELKITFFIIGKDAELEKNRESLRLIPEAGHFIANHSYSHEPWFQTYDRSEVESEVVHAEELIEKVTGIRPRGWRGPGFSFSNTLLDVLAERDYLYDASVFPTFLGPVARLFYFMNSGLNREDREKRDNLYGGFRDGFRPMKPFRWQLGGNTDSLLEIPVTTMPVFRTPVHGSYLLYLSKFCEPAANLYFKTALNLHRIAGSAPSFLLHPTDFLGKEDVPEMSYFPAMDQPAEVKCRQIQHFLSQLKKRFEVVSMEKLAQSILSGSATLKHKPTLTCHG